MKTLNYLLVAAAAVVTANLTQSVQSAEPVLSPRAAQLRQELRTVPTTSQSVNLVTNRPIGDAKAWELAQSLRTIPSTGPSIEKPRGPRPLRSPKDPR